jgi:putative transposase
MPQENTIKTYIENGIYHIYNRGVEKRTIFLDKQDYAVFLHLLKYYLSPINPKEIHPLLKFQNFSLVRPRPLANMEKEINLLAFCLMPNHFHLLLKQFHKNSMTRLMRRILTTYSLYFNKRYDRVGTLFQGTYKAALIDNDQYLLHVSRYIHQNPQNPTNLTRSILVNYPYSSYKYYLGLKHASWLKTKLILSYFDSSKLLPFLKRYPSYQEFVENNSNNSRSIIGKIALE